MGALCAFLFCACYYDYRYRRIPNLLVTGILVAGLLSGFLQQGVTGLLSFLMTVILLVILFYPFFKVGALGAGDVKLFGVCAGYLSCDKILYFIFFSLLIAAAISLARFILKRDVKEYWKMRVPLAGPIFCSILLYIGGVY